MSKIQLATGDTLDLTIDLPDWQIAELRGATDAQVRRASELATDPGMWVEYVDPGATTPYESETEDNRIAYALLTVVANP